MGKPANRLIPLDKWRSVHGMGWSMVYHRVVSGMPPGGRSVYHGWSRGMPPVVGGMPGVGRWHARRTDRPPGMAVAGRGRRKGRGMPFRVGSAAWRPGRRIGGAGRPDRRSEADAEIRPTDRSEADRRPIGARPAATPNRPRHLTACDIATCTIWKSAYI